MKTKLALSVLLLATLTTSCLTTMPTTRVKTISKDPAFSPERFRRALVIGVFPVPERRKMFEEEFAKQFKKYGEQTITSYPVLPTTAGRPQVETLVKDQQIDVVFITRLVSQTTVQTHVEGDSEWVPPGPMDGAVSYFSEGTKEVMQPGYTVNQTVVALETKVFETRTGTCVWTCRSDTLVNGYLDDLIKDYARVMTEALYAPASLPPPAK